MNKKRVVHSISLTSKYKLLRIDQIENNYLGYGSENVRKKVDL